MDAVNDPEVWKIVLKKSGQITGTETLLNNVTGYFIDQDPCPIMHIHPTLDMAEAFSKDRFAPMLRDTPALAALVGDAKSRDSNNTILHKSFIGGAVVTMVGANSPASLASRPIRILIITEPDRFPESAGREGDPVQLGIKRTVTFWNRVIILEGTPTIKDHSKIDAEYQNSDQRVNLVPCPHCQTPQELKWEKLSWEKEKSKTGKDIGHKPETALYICEHCACLIEAHQKTEMIANGAWLATAEFKGIAGFRINELYSHTITWADMVENFLVAKKFPETLKVFVNTSLGEVWEAKGDEVSDLPLFNRREQYAAEVPAGVLVLTTSVDVQKDRLEVETTGWGLGEQNWRVKYTILPGDPSGWDIWDNHLDPLLTMPFRHESGIDLYNACVTIDSGGHHAQMVYEYCKRKQPARFYPIKGSSMAGKPVVSKMSQNNKLNVRMFILGTDTAKDLIFGRLQSITSPGPGYTHFPMEYGEADTPLDDYFKRLTSEHCITKFLNGQSRRVWVKKSQRAKNEPVDLSVYNYAAFKILNIDLESVAANFQAYARQVTPGGGVKKNKGRRILSRGVR